MVYKGNFNVLGEGLEPSWERAGAKGFSFGKWGSLEVNRAMYIYDVCGGLPPKKYLFSFCIRWYNLSENQRGKAIFTIIRDIEITVDLWLGDTTNLIAPFHIDQESLH